MVEGVLSPVTVGAVLKLSESTIGDGLFDLLPRAGMAFDTGVIGAAKGHDMDNAGGIRIRAVMAVRAEDVGAHAIHMVTPGLDMTDRTIRRWIAKRFMARTFDGMGQGQRINQIVMVTGLAINESVPSHAIGDRGLDFVGKRTDIDTFVVGRRTGAIYRVRMATGAFVFVDRMDTIKVGGIEVTAAGGAIFEYPSVNSQIIVFRVVLDGADHRMAGLAGDRRWIAVAAAACRDGVLDRLIATAMTFLTVGEMDRINLSEGVASMSGITAREVTGEGTVRSCAQHIMDAVGIVASDGRMAGGAGVDRIG